MRAICGVLSGLSFQISNGGCGLYKRKMLIFQNSFRLPTECSKFTTNCTYRTIILYMLIRTRYVYSGPQRRYISSAGDWGPWAPHNYHKRNPTTCDRTHPSAHSSTQKYDWRCNIYHLYSPKYFSASCVNRKALPDGAKTPMGYQPVEWCLSFEVSGPHVSWPPRL